MLIPLGFLAVARDMAGLAAHVAGLRAVWAVAGDVPRLVAVVASLAGGVAPSLGAIPRDVPGFIAVVARRLVGTLGALARYMTGAVTSVATVGLLLTVACEVTSAVALEALFTLTVEARVADRTALSALAGEMPRPVALVANA